MKNKNSYNLLTLTVVFVFIFSLFRTVNVLADDSTPPAPTEAPVVEVTATDVPVATDVPAATEVPTEEPPVQEVVNVSDILAQVPEGTDLVVLDENGQLEPLATQNAANIFVNGDPMWCPDGQTPGTDMNDSIQDCTNSYHSFNDLITELQTSTESGSGTIYVSYDYSASDPLATTPDVGNDIIFDYGSVALTDLVVQGGWDFNPLSSTYNSVVGTSTIAGANTFQFWDWGGYSEPASLTINDIVFDGGYNNGTGVYVGPDPNYDDWVDGNVALNNVSVTASDYGAYIYTDSNTSGGGMVTVTGGDFTDNNSTGLTIGDDGYNVWWDYNPGGYFWGYDIYGPVTGNVSVNNSTFSENYAGSGNGNGLEVYSYGNITLDQVNTYENYYDGAYLDNTSGSGYIRVTNNSIFSDNGLSESSGIGLSAYSNGDITLNSVTANGNWDIGAILDNTCGCTTSNIFVSSGKFNTNGQSDEGRGLIAHSNGDITITSITANENTGGGAELINCFFDFIGFTGCLNANLATITLNGTNTFNYNGYNPPQFLGSGPFASVGLWVGSNNGASLSGVTALQNGVGDLGGGAFLFSEYGNLTISNSNFNENCMDCGFGFGFIALDLGGDIALDGVTANGTGNNAFVAPFLGVGGLILNLGGNTAITNSDFSGNCTSGDCSGAGLFILSGGNIRLDTITANGNGTVVGSGTGAMIDTSGNIDIYCSTFSNNAGYGLLADTSGDMTLNGVIFGGNTAGDFDISSGTLAINPFDCNPEKAKKIVNISAAPNCCWRTTTA